ncbi:hypothetical protein Dsin_024417 [Dipteronia sinensis]|uniref:Uncharacterized protein n=1 Tax=Dipteronia sinensis TaxID=43782 RepID=A0AAD9ZUE8_9ROSI|nr:hypothetical protein Dsin_024417 [Dipteronia sinensis]
MNNYESLLPNKKAPFDIPVACTASAYLTSLVLAVAAFVADGSFNGGNNAMRRDVQRLITEEEFNFRLLSADGLDTPEQTSIPQEQSTQLYFSIKV